MSMHITWSVVREILVDVAKSLIIDVFRRPSAPGETNSVSRYVFLVLLQAAMNYVVHTPIGTHPL